jgi:Zn-dependent peptidase ImmA (M78 family)
MAADLAGRLDRMEIEEVGGNPERLAQAIHAQLGSQTGAVPVFEIAGALDIEEVRIEPLSSFEGALLMLPGRNRGRVLLNRNSSSQRRRFTLAHELGHFLNRWHEPADGTEFRCRQQDMIAFAGGRQPLTRHETQEAEANRFAAELLMPRVLLRRHLDGPPCLERALAIAADLDVSKQAAILRYVALHQTPLAMVVARHGRVVYTRTGSGFPRLSLASKAPLPLLDASAKACDTLEAHPLDWLAQPDRSRPLLVDRLMQQAGHELLLLRQIQPADRHEADEDEEGDEDLVDRLARLSSRGQD